MVAAHPSQPAAGVKDAAFSSHAVRVERMRAGLCVTGGEASPQRGGVTRS